MNVQITLILLLVAGIGAVAQSKQRKPYQLYERAEAMVSSGEYDTARALLDDCLSLNPRYMEAYSLRGTVREQLGDLEGALTDYSIYLEEFPMNPDVLMSRAVLRYKIGFYDQARDDFTTLLNLQSEETTAIFYRQNMSVNDRTPIMTTTRSDHDPYVLNYLGLVEYKTNNPVAAIRYFDSAIKTQAKEPDFYVNRGLAKDAAGDSTAIVDFEIALRLNPEHVLAAHNLEVLRTKKLQKLSAEERLTRTIEADSTMLYPYLERAQQRFESGYYEGALDDYNQAAALDPHNFEILFARGLTKEKLRNFEGAFSDYTKAIDLKEDYPKAWLSRGNVLLKLERYLDAIEDYNVAIVYQNDYALAYHNRGMARVKLKQESQACADFRQAEALGMKIDAKIMSKVCK